MRRSTASSRPIVLGVSTAVIGVAVFGEHIYRIWPMSGLPAISLAFPLPFVLLAALRFGPAGASMSLTIIAAILIWMGMNGRGPFSTLLPGRWRARGADVSHRRGAAADVPVRHRRRAAARPRPIFANDSGSSDCFRICRASSSEVRCRKYRSILRHGSGVAGSFSRRRRCSCCRSMPVDMR